MIGRYRVDLQKWKPPRYNLLKLGMRNVTPYRHVNRAQALFNLKLFEKAQEEVQEAIRIAPHYAKAHAILGDIYIERRDYSQAFGILRKASLLDPQNLKTRYQVALVLYHLGDWSEAEAQCQRVLMRKQKNAKGLFLLSRIYAKQQRYDESWDIMQRAFVIAPDRVDDIVEVADIFATREKWSLARKAYNLAFEADRDNEDIKDKIENLP